VYNFSANPFLTPGATAIYSSQKENDKERYYRP
jgi:hypothetical protein